METLIQTLQTLETTILALSTEDCEKVTKFYNSSVFKFRTKIHRERGDNNYRKRYSKEEKKTIQELINQGHTNEHIAELLNRTPDGISQQVQKLIVLNDPNTSKKLVKNFAPSKPRADLLIPQHTCDVLVNEPV